MGWGPNFVVDTIHADGSIDVKIDNIVLPGSSYTLQMPYEVLNPLDNTKTIAGSSGSIPVVVNIIPKP